jgi:hypothetical protein
VISLAARPPDVQPEHDELQALIRETRARQRKRWVGAAALVAVLAGAALGISSITGGTARRPSVDTAGGTPAVKSGSSCGVRVDDMRVVNSSGSTLFREPGDWSPSYPHPSVVRCSGSAVWVVWDNGAAMSKERYVGARSGDGGHTWRLVFAEPFFGVKAPHVLDSYLGPWTLHGPRDAYFTGSCPACGFGTVSLWVTKNAGRTFRMYKVPALTGYGPVRMRVVGHTARISARTFLPGKPRHKTVTLHVA